MADIGRNEVFVGADLDQCLLFAIRRSAPDRKTPVAVMVVVKRDECALIPDEERGSSVAQTLACLR